MMYMMYMMYAFRLKKQSYILLRWLPSLNSHMFIYFCVFQLILKSITYIVEIYVWLFLFNMLFIHSYASWYNTRKYLIYKVNSESQMYLGNNLLWKACWGFAWMNLKVVCIPFPDSSLVLKQCLRVLAVAAVTLKFWRWLGCTVWRASAPRLEALLIIDLLLPL